MKIHANQLTAADIYAAARKAGIDVERLTRHGSRCREVAYDVIFSGIGVTGGQWGNSGTHGAGPYKSATWDEWGIALDHIFRADQSVTIPRVYEDAEDFRWQTDGRFNGLTRADIHPRHRWNYDPENSRPWGGHAEHTCSGCPAVKRFRTRR
jgi:hypothetical protein